MHESIKTILIFVAMVAAVVAAVAWIDDRPNTTTWLLRTVPIAIAIVAAGAAFRLEFKRDLAPDLLARQVGNYFDRNGFCFQFVPTEQAGKCVFLMFFQNRHENACDARVAIRPVTFGGAHETLVEIPVRCPGAAFGLAKREVGLPANLQGKKINFDVGADAEYPDGKGKMLRFKSGVLLRRNTQYVDAFARTTSFLALLGGALMFHRPARLKCQLPKNVATSLPSKVPDRWQILWNPGDPLPTQSAV